MIEGSFGCFASNSGSLDDGGVRRSERKRRVVEVSCQAGNLLVLLLNRRRYRNPRLLHQRRSRLAQPPGHQVLVDQLVQLLLVELNLRLGDHIRLVNVRQRGVHLVAKVFRLPRHPLHQLQRVLLELNVLGSLLLQNRIPHQTLQLPINKQRQLPDDLLHRLRPRQPRQRSTSHPPDTIRVRNRRLDAHQRQQHNNPVVRTHTLPNLLQQLLGVLVRHPLLRRAKPRQRSARPVQRRTNRVHQHCQRRLLHLGVRHNFTFGRSQYDVDARSGTLLRELDPLAEHGVHPRDYARNVEHVQRRPYRLAAARTKLRLVERIE